MFLSRENSVAQCAHVKRCGGSACCSATCATKLLRTVNFSLQGEHRSGSRSSCFFGGAGSLVGLLGLFDMDIRSLTNLIKDK
jgi:hypothetical protein